jgi:hypothetical protein
MLNKYIIIVDVCDYNIMYTVETDDIITFIIDRFENSDKFKSMRFSSQIYEYSDELSEQLYKKCKVFYDILANFLAEEGD